MDMERLVKTLRRHEGSSPMPYRCTEGKLTIGVGHNLDDRGLSDDAIDFILKEDIVEATKDLRYNLFYFDDLPIEVRETLVNLCFNMGISRLLNFKKMFAAIAAQDYHRAADELLDSRYASQVGRRATELADVIRRQVPYTG